MVHHEQLSDKLKKLVGSPRKTKLGATLDSDLCAHLTKRDHDLIFLTHVFKDGSFLGFWSHSPWGGCINKERGWVLLSKDLGTLGVFVLASDKRVSRGSFKDWKAKIREKKGSPKKLIPEWENEAFWKLSDC